MCEPPHPVEHLLDDNPSAHPVVEIDPHGDLILVVGSGDKEPKMRFLVCSRTVARASKAFAAMLYGPFKESRPLGSSTSWVVSLPGDDPKAFEAILHIIHLNLNKIPESVSRHTLFEVFVLGDKYMMRPLLKQNVRRWYKKLSPWYLEYRLNELQIREHLSVARWMSDEAAVWLGLIYYAYNCRQDGSILTYEIRLPKDKEDGSSKDDGSDTEDIYSSPLTVELEHLPRIFIEAILSLRTDILDDLLRWTSEAMSLGSFAPMKRYEYDCCDLMEIEGFEEALEKRFMFPLPASPDDWDRPLQDFVEGLDEAISDCTQAHNEEYGRHNCNLDNDSVVWPKWRWSGNVYTWNELKDGCFVGNSLRKAIEDDLEEQKAEMDEMDEE